MRVSRIIAWVLAGIVCAALFFWLWQTFFWFSQTFRGKPFVQEFVEDAGRSNRLELIYVPVGFSLSSMQAYDFHSLVWKTNNGSGWGTRLQITATDFGKSSTNELWISGIHSIDGANGTAILKVAETFAPTNSPMIICGYSWREWSLVTNAEVRMIRQCVNPFEKY